MLKHTMSRGEGTGALRILQLSQDSEPLTYALLSAVRESERKLLPLKSLQSSGKESQLGSDATPTIAQVNRDKVHVHPFWWLLGFWLLLNQRIDAGAGFPMITLFFCYIKEDHLNMTVLKVRISGVFKKWSDVSLLGMKMLRFAFSLKCGAIFELLIGQKKKKLKKKIKLQAIKCGGAHQRWLRSGHLVNWFAIEPGG